ncbi:hypothetical protein BDF14DRAFT_1441098 [Spinellus fusiger]|nr:hypothetical protein BDF14DRAFT_1441098 [Spinellus fusiger]
MSMMTPGTTRATRTTRTRTRTLLAIHSDLSTSELLSSQEPTPNIGSYHAETTAIYPSTTTPRALAHRMAYGERSSSRGLQIPRLHRSHLSAYSLGTGARNTRYRHRTEENINTIYQNRAHSVHQPSTSEDREARNSIDAVIRNIPRMPFERILNFVTIFTDCGEHSSQYSLSNLQTNDGSVYCNSRVGSMNIKLMHCFLPNDTSYSSPSCSVSRLLLKVPQENNDGPCRSGLVFLTHQPLAVYCTQRYDRFTKHDYDEYMACVQERADMDEISPIAWFDIAHNGECVVDMKDRSGKYLLVKFLRQDKENRYMDIQYIGVVGCSGPRAFYSKPHLR